MANWIITPTQQRTTVSELMSIIESGTNTEKINAAKVLAYLQGQNLKQGQKAKRIKAKNDNFNIRMVSLSDKEELKLREAK